MEVDRHAERLGALEDAPIFAIVEESNQDTLKGTIDLVTIQRAYAANVDSLKALDSVLGNVVNEVGKVG